jgi:ribose 5-phosphate isomerase A
VRRIAAPRWVVRAGWATLRAMAPPNAKEIAGRRAAEFVESGMAVGLGTGSTVHFTLLALAERVRRDGLSFRGVPTSLDTERKAREWGIELASLDDLAALDVTVDGADEVDRGYQLTKGGGGALLREKVVASISRRVVIVVVREKLVPRLGASFPLPVEVVPFARASVERALSVLGGRPVLRGDAGKPYTTDNGNWILDCRFSDGIEDPRELENALAHVPGIVESGLFVDLAHTLVIGDADGGCDVRDVRDVRR